MAQSTDEAAAVGHREMANAIRALAMDAVQAASSGHPGMPMGMADVATVLFDQFLEFDASRPDWPDRDRFVLSAGHGSMLLYALLYLTGYADVTIDELRRFRQLDSRAPGHPEYGPTPGVETTTGPLGQGLANAVGMALAERLLQARYGAGAVDHYAYVLAGDGDRPRRLFRQARIASRGTRCTWAWRCCRPESASHWRVDGSSSWFPWSLPWSTRPPCGTRRRTSKRSSAQPISDTRVRFDAGSSSIRV